MNDSRHERPGIAGSASWVRRAFVVWAVWTFLGVFFASKFYLESHVHGSHAPWTKALWWHLMEWYGWAACSPIIFYACRKAMTDRAHWFAASLIHLGAGTATSLIQVAIFSTGAYIESLVLDTGFSWIYLFKAIIVHHFHFNLFVYAAIAAFWYAREYYRKAAERELKTKELELRLSQAQLHALKMQLQPHFLFNTLNGIAALNYDDPKTANRMLAKLGDLLRLALETDAEISLQEEWDFNQRYLDLEQIRLADRLKVHTDMASETLGATVPSFLLQPLFENAIRHAIAPFPRGGELTLTARRHGARLQLQVIDTGPGISTSELNEEGVGLTNTRARLRNLYGPEHAFSLRNDPAGGLIVDISIPFRLHSANGFVHRSLGEQADPTRQTEVQFENSHAHH